jgi:hypothetical protein
MDQWLLIASQNIIFSIPLAIVFIIGFIEGVLSLLGLGLSSTLDDFFSDIDLTPHSEVSTFSELLSFINKGNIPTLMVFLSALTSFGLLGLIFHKIYFSLFDSFLSNFILVPIIFLLSIPLTSIFSVFLSKILPKDETTAISNKVFIGKVALITQGTASQNRSAEARYIDMYNQEHYIRVKPNNNEEFNQGEKVIIMERETIEGNVFIVQKDPNSIVSKSK